MIPNEPEAPPSLPALAETARRPDPFSSDWSVEGWYSAEGPLDADGLVRALRNLALETLAHVPEGRQIADSDLRRRILAGLPEGFKIVRWMSLGCEFALYRVDPTAPEEISDWARKTVLHAAEAWEVHQATFTLPRAVVTFHGPFAHIFFYSNGLVAGPAKG